MCMIWKNTKIKISKGLAFYAEKESIHFSEEAKNGWQLKHISPFGFYKFQKAPGEDSTWVIDFYDGRKKDIDDYVGLYEDSGWQLVENYRNRYFVFKTVEDVVFNYTDKETYKERLRKETKWMMLQSLWVAIPSLILLLIITFQKSIKINVMLKAFLSGVLSAGVVFPLLMCVLLIYFKIVYRKRPELFNNPRELDKSQKFFRDLVIMMIIGGMLGFIFGIVTSMILH